MSELNPDVKVVSGRIEGDGGVPQAEVLVRFADACVEGSDAELAAARGALESALGRAAVADAAAVVAIFSTDVRVADASGIPLDPENAEVRERIGKRVGIERFREPADDGAPTVDTGG